jgi:hypothetical protein
MGRSLRTISLVPALALSLTLGLASTSSTAPPRSTSLATFEGQVIDLSKGWGRAKACTVWGPNDVRCYASSVKELAAELRGANPNLTQNQALTAATAQVAAAQRASKPDCPSGVFTPEYVCLYDGENWEGRRLKFKEPGKWQSLTTWGFERDASSWANTRSPGFGLCKNAISNQTPCPSNLYVYLPGHASSRTMPSGWNNAAQSIWVVGP